MNKCMYNYIKKEDIPKILDIIKDDIPQDLNLMEWNIFILLFLQELDRQLCILRGR